MGPLAGVRVLEIAGIGPGPFAAMLLADMGAEVLRIERPGAVTPPHFRAPQFNVLARGRRSAAIDLKHPDGAATVLRLVERADLFLEGFRPGVVERLGIGPAACLARNPRLVYGRMTGWGQDGPLAGAAGHDIDYIALAGALDPIGPAGGPPVVPLNLVGDFGGGGMLLAFGLVCGLVEARQSGQGQVVDAAMVDGAALLMATFHGTRAAGTWRDARGSNRTDGGAPFYSVYETADGQYVAVGALEEQFWLELLARLEIDPATLPPRDDRANWPAIRERLAATFRARSRAEWCARLEGTDACFAPVLSMADAPRHPHNQARGTFAEVDGVVQPAPAPRFSRTPGALTRPPPAPGEHTVAALLDWGFTADEVARLQASGAVG